MTYNSDVPPHLSAQPVSSPPGPIDDPRPNTAMLKGDINSGRTGDKVGVFDPGMAMLGTCEEAGGNALSPIDIAKARREESKERWRLSGGKAGDAQGHGDWALHGFVGFMAFTGVTIVGVLWFF